MRIRIITPPTGVIDGIHVELFLAGAVYDLPASLATCLIVEGWAETAFDEAPHASHEPRDPKTRLRPDRRVREDT